MSGPPTNCCPAASRQHVWINCGKASTCSRVGMSSITGVEGHYQISRFHRKSLFRTSRSDNDFVTIPLGADRYDEKRSSLNVRSTRPSNRSHAPKHGLESACGGENRHHATSRWSRAESLKQEFG